MATLPSLLGHLPPHRHLEAGEDTLVEQERELLSFNVFKDRSFLLSSQEQPAWGPAKGENSQEQQGGQSTKGLLQGRGSPSLTSSILLIAIIRQPGPAFFPHEHLLLSPP